MLTPLSIKEIIKKYEISPNKKLGQNFLINEEVCSRIIDLAHINEEDSILEIGCGLGSLTKNILQTNAKNFFFIEKDERFISILSNEYNSYFSSSSAILLKLDALMYDISPINQDGKLKIISNLPYNVGTALLLKWMENINSPELILVMLQKEVVDRIVAKPRHKSYGRLSIISQAFYHCKKEFDVSSGNFVPPPSVVSSVVSLKKKHNISLDPKKLSHLTEVLFSNRRKVLKPKLHKLGIYDKPEFESKRAEDLTVSEITSLLEENTKLKTEEENSSIFGS